MIFCSLGTYIGYNVIWCYMVFVDSVPLIFLLCSFFVFGVALYIATVRRVYVFFSVETKEMFCGGHINTCYMSYKRLDRRKFEII